MNTTHKPDQWKSSFLFVVTLFTILLFYVVLDKAKFTPDQIAAIEAEVREDVDYEMQTLRAKIESLESQMKMRLKLAKADQDLEHEQQLTKLQLLNNDLESKISRFETELGKLKNAKGSVDARLQIVEKELVGERAQRLTLQTKAERSSRKYAELKEQFDAYLQQQKIFYDSFCAHLVKIRKEAPKKVPKSYLEKINGVIRRIRKAESVPLKLSEAQLKEWEADQNKRKKQTSKPEIDKSGKK